MIGFCLLFLNRNFTTSQVILGELTHFDVLWGSCTPKKLTAAVREVLSFYRSPEFTVYLLLFSMLVVTMKSSSIPLLLSTFSVCPVSALKVSSFNP